MRLFWSNVVFCFIIHSKIKYHSYIHGKKNIYMYINSKVFRVDCFGNHASCRLLSTLFYMCFSVSVIYSFFDTDDEGFCVTLAFSSSQFRILYRYAKYFFELNYYWLMSVWLREYHLLMWVGFCIVIIIVLVWPFFRFSFVVKCIFDGNKVSKRERIIEYNVLLDLWVMMRVFGLLNIWGLCYMYLCVLWVKLKMINEHSC